MGKSIALLSSPPGLDLFGAAKLDTYFRHSRRARKYAVCHRPFYLGGLVVVEDHAGKVHFFAGCSFKPMGGTKSHRCCCEEMGLKRALKATLRVKAPLRGPHVLAFVVFGDHQPDDHSGQDRGAVIPCKYCRKKFRWHIARKTGVVTEATLIIGKNKDTNHMYVMSVGELLREFPDLDATYERYLA